VKNNKFEDLFHHSELLETCSYTTIKGGEKITTRKIMAVEIDWERYELIRWNELL